MTQPAGGVPTGTGPTRTPALDEYTAVVGAPEVGELRVLARRLHGRSVKMINSTAVGGGVAEILSRLVPLLTELGLPTRWGFLRPFVERYDAALFSSPAFTRGLDIPSCSSSRRSIRSRTRTASWRRTRSARSSPASVSIPTAPS